MKINPRHESCFPVLSEGENDEEDEDNVFVGEFHSSFQHPASRRSVMAIKMSTNHRTPSYMAIVSCAGGLIDYEKVEEKDRN